MSDRDQYGHYKNDAGVTIEIHQDKSGKDHINFYDGPVDGNHSAVHVDVDYKNGGSWKSETHGEDHSNRENGSGGCFLTSACMHAMTDCFDDNCYELQALRWFRDNYVSQRDIEHYYRVAPAIVTSIDKQPNKNDIYKSIFENVISACVTAIEKRDYEFAYSTYRDSVLSLEEQYLTT